MDIEKFTRKYVELLLKEFGSQIIFIGLQGSYGRGEAKKTSDVDMVTIFSSFTFQTLQRYYAVIQPLAENIKLCGFTGGKQDLLRWNKGELFQLYHDTVPLYGSLDFLLFASGKEAAVEAVRSGSCLVYHGCAHNYLYERDWQILSSLYKMSVFVLQGYYYTVCGHYCRKHRELAERLTGLDRQIIMLAMSMEEGYGGNESDFAKYSGLLLSWSQSVLQKLDVSRETSAKSL